MAAEELNFVNLNIGLLGHVDSGKTSLARALSDTLSTASLDKNPQSKARGISLDLGFSSFRIPLPEHLEEHREQGIQVRKNFSVFQKICWLAENVNVFSKN